MSLPISGVWSAIVTPLDEDFSPGMRRIVAHARRLLEQGCHGLAVLGTTGEATSFSLPERQRLLEGLVAAGIAPSAIMPGVGACNAQDTADMTRHALSLDVEQVIMLPPFYYKDVSVDGLFAHYSNVIEDVAEERMKLLLYHIPQISGVPIPHELIERLRKAYPGTVVGIKDSSGDLDNMLTMLERFDNFAVFTGADQHLRAILPKGGAGSISAAANLVATELRQIYDNPDDCDAAQARVTAVRACCTRHPQIPVTKALLAERFGDESWRRVRAPLSTLEGEALEAALADWASLD